MFNVQRPTDIPACLTNGRYNDREVVDILIPMFFGKCYLCEQDELSDPEIEHLDPHEGDDTKKLDWENLFLACSRCNSIKGTTHRELLNCADPALNAFRAITCLMPRTPDEDVQISTSLEGNDKAERTANLLRLCYNSQNTPLRGVTRSVLIEKLFIHYTEYLKLRMTIMDKRSSDSEVALAKGRLCSMFKVSFPFSVFWRWHLLKDTVLLKKISDAADF